MPELIEQLNAISSSHVSWEQDRATILAALEPKARAAVETFQFEEALVGFSRWCLDLLRKEPPSDGIRGLNFGLFETKGGCKLYVSGAVNCDPDDSDWACANDWWPEGRYAPLEQLVTLWRALKETEAEPWVVVQAVAIVLVKSFFAHHEDEFRDLSGLNEVHVATGFDDGDLYLVWNMSKAERG